MRCGSGHGTQCALRRRRNHVAPLASQSFARLFGVWVDRSRVLAGLPQQPRDFVRNLRNLPRRDKSQYGEQALLARHLPATGTYLEIGAYQPVILSNTWALSRQGWRGWSIDAEGSYRTQWRIFRPGDEFMECAVVAEPDVDEVALYAPTTGVGNTASLSREHVDSFVADPSREVSARRVPAIGVAALFRAFVEVFGGGPLLLLMDCEGLDATLMRAIVTQVPQAHWPRYLLIEELESVAAAPRELGYREEGRAGHSTLLTLANRPL